MDILIATDVISEGQNLQDADMMVNFDIHWNPVRIIQRFGRVDRIGSKNKYIQLVNFWPNIELDEYIGLKSRVESRMKISVLTATADENILTNEEIEDNNYRQKQLERLKNEVVDLEEMNQGVSIMDLGLEDYRMDLLRYLDQHPELEKVPRGLQTVIQVEDKNREGVIFVLKNVKGELAVATQNRLHPYYLVYMNREGKMMYAMDASKDLLEYLRMITRDQSQPNQPLVSLFNKETKDGSDMKVYSELLHQAIEQLIEQNQTSQIDALFTQSSFDFMETNSIEGVDDFELICFFVLLRPEVLK
ncbi:helicase-related protein [Streptococcus uberis]|uniref:helicase-related protein n=1 Tax=Streptococcus uberis TaxID=1349 RepID=UPI0030C694DC